MNHEEENKLIAEFMELKRYWDGRYGWIYPNPVQGERGSVLGDKGLKYHSSWEWLMPVIEKIEKANYGFKMCRKVVEIYFDDSKEVILTVKENSRLNSLHKAVVEFIKWYNQQTNNFLNEKNYRFWK